MWFDNSVIYQIYPLGLCGAPRDNDGVNAHRILKLLDWVEHIRKTGADTLLLNPVFESDRHGYDTRDYRTVDCRLGTNEDLKTVCDAFHQAGIRVMLDGVFNHVGRGFWAFRDVQEKKWESPYKDWFRLSFDGNSHYNDGFWYEGWEGHYELVKLNLSNPEVVRHQQEAIRSWVERFGIDGLRLDVAYCLSGDYLRQLRAFTDTLKPDFALVGECLHGDYNRWMNDSACHAVTNYECYKGLWSSFNSMNLFEIGHSLQRQFGKLVPLPGPPPHELPGQPRCGPHRLQAHGPRPPCPGLRPALRYARGTGGVLRQRVGHFRPEGPGGRRPAPRSGKAGVERSDGPHRPDGPRPPGKPGPVLGWLPQHPVDQPPDHL